MAPNYRDSQRPYRNLTIADWMTPANRSQLIVEPPPPPSPTVPLPQPSLSRLAAPQKEPSDWELAATLGCGRWRSTPKDKHVVRMYITAAVSVFAEVMRPSLERKADRIFNSFSETVDFILPYWDQLTSKDRDAWARRASDTNKSDHYIYLRVARPRKTNLKMGMSRVDESTGAGIEEDDHDGYETDPDELPGFVCGDDVVEEKKNRPTSIS